MLEDLPAVRRRALEYHNGRTATWWHYNRMTLVVAMSAAVALLVWLQVERHWRVRAEAQVQLLSGAHLGDLACFSVQRSTSIIIAADSQQAANQALIDAGNMAVLTRERWKLASGLWGKP